MMHIFSTGHRIRLLFASCWLWAVCGPALAVPGDWERIGLAGDWKDTTAGTLFKGRLYTVEKSGALYVTDLRTGEWKKLGKTEFAGTNYLVAGKDRLFSIDQAGNLYAIDPTDGSRRQVGAAGDWKATIATAVLGNTLYSAETSGKLYETDLPTGKWQALGKADFANTTQLFTAGGMLYSLEKDGSLYSISRQDGSWERLGPGGDWKGTLAGTVHAGKLFTVESSGCLYETLLNNAKWKQVGKADFANTRFLFSAGEALANLEANGNPKNVQRLPAAFSGEALYSIEADGSLYRIKVK
jgi:hypothetical protein